MRCAFRLALLSAGSSMAAKIAMMAITTSNSIKVKPSLLEINCFTLILSHALSASIYPANPIVLLGVQRILRDRNREIASRRRCDSSAGSSHVDVRSGGGCSGLHNKLGRHIRRAGVRGKLDGHIRISGLDAGYVG